MIVNPRVKYVRTANALIKAALQTTRAHSARSVTWHQGNARKPKGPTAKLAVIHNKRKRHVVRVICVCNSKIKTATNKAPFASWVAKLIPTTNVPKGISANSSRTKMVR